MTDTTNTQTQQDGVSGEGTHNDDGASGINYETEARRMGWRPESEFRGDKSKFVDAKTFYENGIRVLPIVNAANDALRQELTRLRSGFQEVLATNEKAHQREVKELKDDLAAAMAARKEAVGSSDGDAFEIADNRVREITAKLASATAPQAKQPISDPIFEAWSAENKWLTDDPELTAIATSLGATRFKHLQGKGREFYDKVGEAVKQYVQARDGTDLRRPGPTAPRHGDGTRPTSGQKSYDNLLPEYQKTCDRQYKEFGLTIDKGKWRERYVNGCSDDAFKRN